jgi:hypothetical protein
MILCLTENIAEADLLTIYTIMMEQSFVNGYLFSNALSFSASFMWNGLTSMTSDDADKGSDPGDS